MLYKHCRYEGHMYSKDYGLKNDWILDEEKLKVMGILWCDGTAIEKAQEVFDLLQEGGMQFISFRDKDMKRVLFALLDMATQTTVNIEADISQEEPVISQEVIAEGKDKYQGILYDFINKVFG